MHLKNAILYHFMMYKSMHAQLPLKGDPTRTPFTPVHESLVKLYILIKGVRVYAIILQCQIYSLMFHTLEVAVGTLSCIFSLQLVI